MLGATASYIILFLMVFYGVEQGIILVNRIRPEVLRTTLFRDLSADDVFTPSDLGFSFAFGLDPGAALTPDYGYYTVNAITLTVNTSNPSNPTRTAVGLPLVTCGTQYFNYKASATVKYGIDKY